MEDVTVQRAFTTFSESLHRYASRLTGDPDVAEDLVQEAFVRFAREQGIEHHRAWLFRVVSNLAINAHRSTHRRSLLKRVWHRHVLSDAPPDPDEAYETLELRQLVQEALAKLSDRDRVLLLMREEGFKHAEIAAAIGSTPKSVGTLLARALTRVAVHLEEVKEALTS